MSTIKLHVAYRFPRVLHRKFSFDTYECEWKDSYGQTIDMEVPEVNDVTDIIEAMAKLTKPDNGCDAVRYTFTGSVGDVQVTLERTIDIHFHTTIFPDGRRVQWVTSDDDYYKNNRQEKLNAALAEVGYHDLIK